MMRHSQPSGFALLLTLILVVIVGIAFTGLARWSMLGAVELRDDTAEVQRRWAVTSCRATLLPRIGALLDEAELTPDQNDRPTTNASKAPPVRQRCAELRVVCRLADLDYELVLTDEQAKLNVDRLLARTNAEDTQQMTTRLLGHWQSNAANPVARVKLRPMAPVRSPSGEGTALPQIGSYGQFLDNVAPHDLLGTAATPGLAQAVTCWGDGRVNIFRAPVAVIQELCSKTLMRDATGALVALRESDSSGKLSVILSKLANCDDKQKAKLAEFFSDQSRCFGLWIVAKDAHRSWYNLSIGLGGKVDEAGGSSDQMKPRYQLTERYDLTW